MVLDKTIIKQKLQDQKLGTPSWGYGDSGTRFHVYHRTHSPRNLEERIQDAAQVQKFTGVCPYIDLHTAWDSSDDWDDTRKYANSLGLQIGAINPHLFNEDDYVLGSVCNPSERIRKKSINKLKEGIEIGKRVGSKVLSLWFADGTNYPGQDNFKKRKRYLEEGLREVYEAMPDDMKMVIEYKFFEPAFYHMDLADWGTSYLMACKLGERAKVLVDLGHHALGTNIEQIVAILLSERKLGGFHFNDKKYGDDDLTVGSSNPYQLFLIYCELVAGELDPHYTDEVKNLSLMIDQNHNIKNQIEGTIQSVIALQTAYAKALLVDYEELYKAQSEGDLIHTEEILKEAYNTDVRPLLEEIRAEMGFDKNPLQAFQKSGYMEKIRKERS